MQFGFDKVMIDSAGNVIARAGSGRPRLLFCGHMDTIPGEIQVRVENGRVYGRGAVDAKSSLCSLIMAARNFLDDREVGITVACVTREESDSLGIKSIINSRDKYDYAIFGEPGGANKITIGYRGRAQAKIIIEAEGGHAGSPWAHKGALDSTIKLINKLRDYELAHRSREHFDSLSFCVTILRSGEYPNVIPRRSEITLDIRVPINMRCDDVVRDIADIAQAVGREDGVALSYSFDEVTEPYKIDIGSTIVRAFQRAVIMKGMRPLLLRKTGTGDMNTFASATGIECVTYGPGDSNLSHTDKEFISIDEYKMSIEVLVEAVKQLKELDANRADRFKL